MVLLLIFLFLFPATSCLGNQHGLGRATPGKHRHLTWWGASLPFDHVDVCTFTNKNDGMMFCAALISTPMSSVLDLHQ